MMGYAVQRRFHSNSNPTAEKSWIGVNRGGYLNPEWDALGDRFLTTLEESGRLSVERELLGLFNADLPALPLSYSLQLTPVGGGLTGIQPITGVPHQGTVLYAWNVHEWDLSGKTQ
jgi:ABC-type transport system substrate-binding protein